jgi:hypothetical protein
MASQPAWAQGPPYLWSDHFGDLDDQSAASVATDSSGNVVIFGDLFGTMDCGGGTLASAGVRDVFLAKFDADGNHLWSNRFGDESWEKAIGVAVDTLRNVFITGYFYDTIDFGGGVLTSAGEGDVFLAKFDANGNYIWSDRFGDAGYQYVEGIAVDLQGNVVITGFFYGGNIDFGGGTLVNAGGVDIFAAKFDTDGTHLWSDNYGDADDQSGGSVAIDGSGNVMVAGGFDGTVNFGGQALVSSGNKDVFLAKFDPSGNHLWSDSFGDSEWQRVGGVVADGSESVYLAGSFRGAIDFGGGALTSAGGFDIYVAKFNASGDHVWSQRFGDSGTSMEYAACVAADHSGDVVIAGNFSGTVDFGGGALTTAGNRDIFLASFDPSGTHLWSQRYGDENVEAPYGVAAYDECVYLAGKFEGSIDFGGGELTSAGGEDCFLAKFGDDSTPTLLRSHTAVFTDAGIAIKWELADAGVSARFFVLRAGGKSAEYRRLENAKIERENLSFTFVDENYHAGLTYRYRVDVVDEDGLRVLFETAEIATPVSQLTLDQNSPNPFNPTTTISFTLPKKSFVNLSIFNLEGKLVTTIVDGMLEEGFKEYRWDGNDARGFPVSSGVYFYRLKAGNRTLTKKMSVVK